MISSRVALVLLVACGGTSDDERWMPPGSSGGWVPSDIDEQQTLAQIGNAGYSRLCSAFSDYVHDQYRSSLLIKASCTAHALDTTTDAVACGAALDECLDTLPPVVEAQLNSILAQASCSQLQVDPAMCQSKISRLKACLDALGDKVKQIQLSATCAAVGSPVPATWWMIAQPAECTSLSADC